MKIAERTLKIQQLTMVLTKNEAIGKLKHIWQNIERAIRLVELDAPLDIVANESRMIQRRALAAEAYYEEYLEVKNDKTTRDEIDTEKRLENIM